VDGCEESPSPEVGSLRVSTVESAEATASCEASGLKEMADTADSLGPEEGKARWGWCTHFPEPRSG